MPSPSRVAESDVTTIASILYVLPVVPPETQKVIMLFLLLTGELATCMVCIVKSLVLPSIFSAVTLVTDESVSLVASKLLNSIENFLCSAGCLQSLSLAITPIFFSYNKCSTLEYTNNNNYEGSVQVSSLEDNMASTLQTGIVQLVVLSGTVQVFTFESLLITVGTIVSFMSDIGNVDIG